MKAKLLPLCRTFLLMGLLMGGAWVGAAADVASIAGKRILFLGDSITQAGYYVTFASYYLEKLHPAYDFEI